MELDKIKGIFIDEDGKPKQINIIIITIILAIILIILKTLIPTSPEEEVSSINVDYNLPAEEEKSTVKIGKNADIGYVTKGELEYTLSKQLEKFAQIQAETLSIVLETSQHNMMQTIQDETRMQRGYIEKNIEKRFIELEEELKMVKKNNKEYETLLKEMPVYSLPSDKSSSMPESYYTSTRTVTRGVPVNDYTGYANSNYQSSSPGYSTSNTYETENIRNDSGFIVNNYQIADAANYIINSGEIYQSGYLITDGVLSGQLYKGVLITGAVSSKTKCPVVVKLTEDIIVKDKILIPKESRLTGFAIADFNTRQIYFDIDRLILNDREIAIKASLVNKDGTPGFCSKYIDKTNEQFWKTFALNFVSSVMQGYKDITYFVTDKGIPVKSYDDTSLNKAIDATSEGLTSFASRLMADAQAMGAIILVNPNIEVQIMIEDNISLERITK